MLGRLTAAEHPVRGEDYFSALATARPTLQCPRAKNGAEWVEDFFRVAAVLLSFERICYLRIWFAPAAFQTWCARFPMDGSASRSTRCAFFSMVSRFCNSWFLLVGVIFHGDGSLLPFGGSPWSLGLGLALIAGGQMLNLTVFYRLGKVGVFYGDRFDHQVPWCRGFPSHCSNIRNMPALCSPSEVSFSSWAFPTWLVLTPPSRNRLLHTERLLRALVRKKFLPCSAFPGLCSLVQTACVMKPLHSLNLFVMIQN